MNCPVLARPDPPAGGHEDCVAIANVRAELAINLTRQEESSRNKRILSILGGLSDIMECAYPGRVRL
jgi:hypothetical protein